jgi:hypothetical protein
MPYALDNGAFPAFTKKIPWDRKAWLKLLGWSSVSGQPPMWILAPDVVGDREKTITSWHENHVLLATLGIPLAFAVQDGMTAKDVPEGVSVIFVGGSTEWKWKTAPMWGNSFPRVHIGRVNTWRLLRLAEDAGAESCDGTGWFRGDKKQREGLEQWLRETWNGDRKSKPSGTSSGGEARTCLSAGIGGVACTGALSTKDRREM